jgi:hypothetical protein
MINTQEYTTKLAQVTNGQITEQEWKDYCMQLLAQILDQPEVKAIMVRLKDR